MKKMTMLEKGIRCIPIYSYYELKNPVDLFGRKLADIYDEDRVRYVEEPIFDKDGNYIKTVTNAYVTMKKLVRFMYYKPKQQEKPRRKLFETYSDIKKREEKEKLEELENE